MTTIRAVYQGGVLRPAQPLDLADGETVEVTITKPASTQLTEEEIDRRIREAKTFQEWFEATKLLPPDDDGYDIEKALYENRYFPGWKPTPPEEGGNT